MCTCAKRRRQGTSNWNARAFCPCPLVLTAGGALGGFASMALLACLAWFVVTRRRAADQIGLVSSTMQAVVMQAAHPQPGGWVGGWGPSVHVPAVGEPGCLPHSASNMHLWQQASQPGNEPARMYPAAPPSLTPRAGVNARLSIIPGVKERFELTEVVEQTGSPYSARRRNKTAFSRESPKKTPLLM